MRYYTLQPEVAGGMGSGTILDSSTHPPRVSKLVYEFSGWLGDDLLETFPCYIVTARLKEALEKLYPSGCDFDEVQVTKSDLFMEIHGDRELPEFAWLKVTGRAGVDDFGLSAEHNVVASERVLECMKRFSLAHCEVEQYRSK